MFSPQIIILYFMSQLKIYTKRKVTYKKENLEHNCVLQESCKTVRRWQRSVLLVKGGHCVGDWLKWSKFTKPFFEFLLPTLGC